MPISSSPPRSASQVDANKIFSGKSLIGLYFSAHWCGPCRNFTPKLCQFYEDVAAGGELEIVFGSSDRDAAAFQEYFAEMPWKALPFGDARVEQLKKKYGVSGIPWLVILDAEGNLVHNEADTAVGRKAAADCIAAWKAGNKA